MTITGGCYCGAVRYEIKGDIQAKFQCYCRECCKISGGNPNVIACFVENEFTYVAGEPTCFMRDDIENAVQREFCNKCGTPILTRAPATQGMVYVKVGSLDEPVLYGKADIAIQLADKQSFHLVDDAIMTFERFPE